MSNSPWEPTGKAIEGVSTSRSPMVASDPSGYRIAGEDKLVQEKAVMWWLNLRFMSKTCLRIQATGVPAGSLSACGRLDAHGMLRSQASKVSGYLERRHQRILLTTIDPRSGLVQFFWTPDRPDQTHPRLSDNASRGVSEEAGNGSETNRGNAHRGRFMIASLGKRVPCSYVIDLWIPGLAWSRKTVRVTVGDWSLCGRLRHSASAPATKRRLPDALTERVHG